MSDEGVDESDKTTPALLHECNIGRQVPPVDCKPSAIREIECLRSSDPTPNSFRW